MINHQSGTPEGRKKYIAAINSLRRWRSTSRPGDSSFDRKVERVESNLRRMAAQEREKEMQVLGKLYGPAIANTFNWVYKSEEEVGTKLIKAFNDRLQLKSILERNLKRLKAIEDNGKNEQDIGLAAHFYDSWNNAVIHTLDKYTNELGNGIVDALIFGNDNDLTAKQLKDFIEDHRHEILEQTFYELS